MNRAILTVCLVLVSLPALAQIGQPVNPYSIPRVLDNESGTVASSNVFQQVFAANANRLNCVIQNTSSDAEYVFFGATADAMTGKSVKLSTGQSTTCASESLVYQGAVQITGTMSDAFYATGQ